MSITCGSVLSKQIKFKVTQEKLSVSTFLNPEISRLSSKDYTYVSVINCRSVFQK